jgi:hypothetical protein
MNAAKSIRRSAMTLVVPRQTNAAGTSVLFALQPRGLGTPFVESLSGYVRRLAAAHVLRHAMFLDRVVLEQHRRMFPDDTGALMMLSSLNQTINGGARMGGIVSGHLEAMTWAPVRRTSFYGRTDDFWMRRAFREYRAWCPECLEQDGAEPYDRLVWAMAGYTTCVLHSRALTDECTSCHQKRRPLRADVRETLCPCGAALTTASARRPVDATSERVAEFVGLLESGTRITRSQLGNGFAHLLAEAGSYRELRERGFKQTGFHRLIHGQALVEFGTFLDTVVRSGEDVATFLAHAPVDLPKRKLTSPKRRVTRGTTAVNGNRARIELRHLMAGPGPVPTLDAFCRAQRVSADWMKREEPELVSELVTRGKAARNQRKRERIASERAEVIRELESLRARFGEITWKVVNENLSRPGLVRDRRIAAVVREYIREYRERERKVAA